MNWGNRGRNSQMAPLTLLKARLAPQKLYQKSDCTFRGPAETSLLSWLKKPEYKNLAAIVWNAFKARSIAVINFSTWRLNLAISNLMTPMVKPKRRKVSNTLSTYSMPVMRHPPSTSLSPYLARRNNQGFSRTRTPSVESIGAMSSVTPIEPRSRKASAKSQLTPVLEGGWRDLN